jgi:protein-tyrosine phosphatase
MEYPSMNNTMPARERVITLKGACNFRDIGGYTAGDGRTVQWGKVYRAGVLTYFTPGDQQSLAPLQVRAIVDLRRDDERQREPGRWPDSTPDALFWPDDANMPTVRGYASQRPFNAAGMRDAMIELYKALPAWMGPRIRGMLEAIANDRVPMIVHCAAGKDRTGVAIAVLMKVLGVDDVTVMQDYLLTNDAGNFEEFVRSHRESHLGLADAHRPLLSMQPDIRQVLYAADADYLNAALEVIETQHGGTDGYLANIVGVSEQTLDRVRLQLLE